MNMNKLLSDLYTNYGMTENVGIDYFKSKKNQIINLGINKLIKLFICEKYPIDFADAMLLSVQELWINLTVPQILDLMEELNPRPNPIFDDYDEVCYLDIYFFCKYLGIDIVSFYVQSKRFNVRDKVNVLIYAYSKGPRLLPNDIDNEFLDGEHFVSLNTVIKFRKRILENDAIKIHPKNYHDLTVIIRNSFISLQEKDSRIAELIDVIDSDIE